MQGKNISANRSVWGGKKNFLTRLPTCGTGFFFFAGKIRAKILALIFPGEIRAKT
jgi:hypothetical protein